MKKLYDSIKTIGNDCKNVAVMFSTGRDSIVMLDLFMTYARKSVEKVIFMYYCKGLSYSEKILKYYEKRYKIKIERISHFDVGNMLNSRVKKRRLKLTDSEQLIRNDYNVDFIAFGYRKDESLQRRGMLSHIPDNIDYKYKKVYPIADWTSPHIRKYVATKKLILPIEYKNGFRDLNAFKGVSLEYIYNNYREDYEKIIKVFPDVQGELLRIRSQNA